MRMFRKISQGSKEVRIGKDLQGRANSLQRGQNPIVAGLHDKYLGRLKKREIGSQRLRQRIGFLAGRGSTVVSPSAVPSATGRY